jgi:hypothetical protein
MRGGRKVKSLMSILPSVHARLAERFIFNFRMAPQQMNKFLPVDWLEPAQVGGHAIASFCLLDLRNINIAPLSSLTGLTSLSCAPRYAVIDVSSAPPQPAVFVTERYTNSAFGSWFTSLGFSAPHPHVEATIARGSEDIKLLVRSQGAELFAATVRAGSGKAGSLFTPETFREFLAQGVTSYGMSIHSGRLTKVNLHKQDDRYEPLDVASYSGTAVEEWVAAGAVLDSAFRTANGNYEWEYLGLTS